MKPVAKIKSTLDIQLDLTRPVEELTEVISAVIASQPARRKEILEGLDLAVGNALERFRLKRKKIKKQMMIAQEKFPERRGEQVVSQIKMFGSTVWTAIAGTSGKEVAAGGMTALVGLMVTFLGGWDKSLRVLLIMMAIDYIFGVLGAVKTKSVNSDVMFWGGIRKITVLLVVGLAAQLDDWIQPGTPIFRTAAIYFYVGREGLSVVENLGTMGVPLPFKLKNFLQQLNDKGDGKDATTKQP